MVDLKKEYLKMYNELLATIEVINKHVYTNEGPQLKLDYISKAYEILKKGSKLA